MSASVAVWSKADKALAAGAIVRQDGSFRIEGLKPGTYYVKLTMLGYATQTTPDLVITANSPRLNLGSVKLERAAIEVAGVEATAERAVVIAPDRNSYRVKDVAPGATTASDVLESVPSVQVDADGKVSLRGNENVVVQINGRPTPIRGAQLAGYLRQLPANTIERVEVIPNPSAKQDPEGMAGIINIVMKQGVDLGTSGGFTLSGSTADRYSGGANIGHQSGPLAFFVSYGYSSDERLVTGINDRTRLLAPNTPRSFTEQDVNGTNGNSGHNFSFNSDYQFNKRDVLSTTLQLNRRRATDGTTMAYSELNGAHEVQDRYDRLRDSGNRNWLADASLAFKHTITPQHHELSAEVRYNHQNDRDETDLWRQAIDAAATRSDLENDLAVANTNSLTAQLDYTRDLSKVVKLETGYKLNVRWLDRDFAVMKDAVGNGAWLPSDLSNALTLDENVNAAYGVLSKSGKKVDLQGGLRAEYATRDFTLANTGESFPHTYRSLFPSGLLNYKLNDKSQAKLSYSRRIRRPGTQELNPFPVFMDLQNVFLGNAQLDPEYTDAIELGYQRSGTLGTLQFTPFYRRTTNVIRVDINTADTVSNREVTSVSFKNLDHSSSWGADVNGQFRFGKVLSGLASFNVFKMVTDGGSESSLSSDAVSWSVRFNATYNVNAATSVTAMYNYRAPVNIERGRFASQSMANIAFRQKFYGDKATAIIRLADPFNTMRFRVNVGDDNIVQLTERQFNARAAYFSIQYNFGKAPRLRQRKQDDQPQSSNPFGN